MFHMIKSQMSHTKLDMKMLVCDFTAPDKPPSQLVLEFLQPFYHALEQKRLKVEVIEANEIPCWACTDWSLYLETLFHVIQNAIKFNAESGSIKIVLSYHSLAEEAKQKRQKPILADPEAEVLKD